MKCMLMGFLSEGSNVDGGYRSASQGIASVLLTMRKNNLIDDLILIDYKDFNNASLNIDIDVGIMICSPYGLEGATEKLKSMKERCKKLYLSLVWETNTLPKGWKFLWNHPYIDGFVSPSSFVLEQIQLNTDKDCFLLPHFIDVNAYTQIDIDKKIQETEFKVLFLGQHTERKGYRDAIIAYLHSIYPYSDCSLIIKYHEMSSMVIEMEKEIQSLVQLNQPKHEKIKSSIYLISDNITKEEMEQLYQECSVLLAPARGEGFGLPPAECMSTGIPVIYTDWASMPEVCASPANIAVDYHLDLAYNMTQFGYESDQEYAVPSIKSIKQALEQKYSQWKQSKYEYYQNAIKNRDIIEKKFGLESIIRHLLHIMNA